MFHPSVAGHDVVPPTPAPVAEAIGVARGMATLPSLALRRPPRGDGGIVRVLPGYLTGDSATVVMRGTLRALGYRSAGWGLGVNRGNVPVLAGQVAALVGRDAEESGRPVRLVGWSLGGVIAREAARLRPEAVSHVVTLGTPIVGGPVYTAAATSYAADGWDLDEVAATVAARNAEPMPVPVTALFSRDDTVVAWQACLDPNPLSPTRHIEVPGRHAELGFSPRVLRVVAQALADGA
jgi:pimeloyl-ACP methyl ester carboxylesterase